MSSQSRLRIRPRGWLVLIPAIVVLFVAYRLMGALSADSLFAVNASCQFALIILGVIVAVKPQTGVDRPWLVIGLFVVLGGIGMVAAVRQQQVSARETAEAQRQLAESNAKLSSSIEKTAEIAQEAIGASTGGESFCYLTPTWRRDDGTPVIWVFAQQGKSPLYDVEVMVVNLQFYDPSKIERGKEVYLPFKIGDMPVGSVWADMDVDLPFNKSVNIPFNKAKKERQDYQINFTARNGWWTQDLLWQKVGDRWLTATRVFREGPDPKTGGIGDIKKLIFMSIEEGFPGEPDWYPGKEALERRKLEDGTEKIDRKPLPDQRP